MPDFCFPVENYLPGLDKNRYSFCHIHRKHIMEILTDKSARTQLRPLSQRLFWGRVLHSWLSFLISFLIILSPAITIAVSGFSWNIFALLLTFSTLSLALLGYLVWKIHQMWRTAVSDAIADNLLKNEVKSSLSINHVPVSELEKVRPLVEYAVYQQRSGKYMSSDLHPVHLKNKNGKEVVLILTKNVSSHHTWKIKIQ